MKKSLLFLFVFALSHSLVADIVIEQPLSFGEIAVRDNASVSSVTITRNGVQQSTNQILIIRPGTPGVIGLTSFTPYTMVNLSVDLPAFSAETYPGSAQFEMTNIDMQSSINISPNGTAQFRIGGTISTSGNPAVNYVSGADYTIYLNLNVTY